MIRTTGLLLACALVAGCGVANAAAVTVTPYGRWTTAQGHSLTIQTDGTYRICRSGQCSSGRLTNRYSRLAVDLRDLLSRPELSDLAAPLRECLDWGYQLAGGRDPGLGPDDVEFDPRLNRGWNAEDVSGPITVTFDCTEGQNPLTFVKQEDFRDARAAAEIERWRALRRRIPPPSIDWANLPGNSPRQHQ